MYHKMDSISKLKELILFMNIKNRISILFYLKVKLIFILFIIINICFFVSCNPNRTLKKSEEAIEHFWSKDELAITHLSGKVSTYTMTIDKSPPYYEGPIPFQYKGNYLLKNLPGYSTPEIEVPPISYEFTEYIVYFVQNETGTRVIGAQVYNLSNNLLAEAKEISDNKIKEVHYNTSGEVVFQCVSIIEHGSKNSETNTAGNKNLEYFFLWPGYF